MKRMKIEYLATTDLIPYENNPRLNDGAVDAVAASIKEFGFQVPIVIDKRNVIVAGHTRLKAAEKLGLSEVPCIRADELTDEQVKAFRLADNKVSEFALWDNEKLNVELSELAEFDIDMSQFGFDLDVDPVEIEEDDFDEESAASAPPRVKRGEVWKLGEHRLMCGDSTNSGDVAELMQKDHADVLFTSPPYADLRTYGGDKNVDVSHLVNFIPTYRDYTDYQCVNLGLKRHDAEIIRYWDEYISAANECGYKLLAWNVWDKLTAGSIGNQSAFFPIRHEWVFVFGTEFYEVNLTWEKRPESILTDVAPKLVRQKDGTMKRSSAGDYSHKYKQMESVLHLLPEHGKVLKDHPAPFPIALPAEYIQSMTNSGDIVIEPFGGSGTTLIACEQLGRKCCMMELDPHYCDVIIKRWEDFTGGKAVLVNG